jgi:CheY-like chemotaxis protein
MSRILVIDDDQAVRTAIKTVLEHNGFDVVVAEDGRSGIAEVQGRPFDVVIVDIFMEWTAWRRSGLSTSTPPRCR